MKRNLVALAVAGAFLAPAAAWADGSGVTLTGVVHGDIGFGQEENDDGDEVYKRQSNIGTFATRWNIEGTEDLGWSQVIFGLAFDQQFAGPNRRQSGGGLNNNNNQADPGSIQNRNSYLGLTGGWGTLKIGQNEHLYEIQQILQDPDPASENSFSTLSLMTDWGGTHQGFTRRDSQSIWYASPNFGGLVIEAAYITPAGADTDGSTLTTGGVQNCALDSVGNPNPFLGQDAAGNPIFDTSVNGCFATPTSTVTGEDLSPFGAQVGAYWKSAFGLSLYGAFAQYNDFDGADSKNRAFRVGVGYGTEFFQVDVFGEKLQYTGTGVATDVDDERTNFGVSGALNFGQHHIRAAYSMATDLEQDGEDLEDSGAKLFLIGYAYTLSKRTELQVNYGKLDNELNAQFGAAGGGVGAPGNDSDRFGIGIRHTF